MAAVALITGALSDIGRATARELARSGFSVVLDHRRSSDEAERLAGSLVRDHGAPWCWR
jgi:NAD(P)-dependent dehydrogenase (short-subunit alcohol dehydrogenase family)